MTSPNTHPQPPPSYLLGGRAVLVTGASRGRGIGAAVARHCARAGAAVAVTGLSRYDHAQGYPAQGVTTAADLAAAISAEGHRAVALPDIDLRDPDGPARLLCAAESALGAPVDGLVVNHAHSTRAPLGRWDAGHIDDHLAANVRAAMLLLQSFADRLPAARPGAAVLMTSGQYLGPMPDEIAYAVSKEAVRALTAQAAAVLAARSVRVNCLNPGPTDTAYLTGPAHDAGRAAFPTGRWGMPDDAARAVVFLLSDEARWVTGQTLASEGGFRRS